jgi:hypothetical protein
MSTSKTITICASAAHYRQVLEIEKELQALGFNVEVPKTAKLMAQTGNFDVDAHKTWYKNKADYSKKTELMEAHFQKVLDADAILVTNYEKRGIPGYIGGNVLMEMTLAFHYRKPIYILNPIAEDLGIAEEVNGLQPIFLDGDLSKVKL